MGGGSYSSTRYARQAERAKKTTNSGFTARSMLDEFDPKRVNMRHSKRGPFNHFRDVLTILVGLDVTGSMGKIPKSLLTGDIGKLMKTLQGVFSRPNENLQLSFAGIGDAKTDTAPLQVTHFESDNRFAEHLPKIWLEGRGGGNGGESYNILWYYAANKTHLNYVEDTGQKGVLITVGDDNVHSKLTASQIKKHLDPKYSGGDVSNEVLLDAVREQYNVYHIIVTDGSSYDYDVLKRKEKSADQIAAETKAWKDMLGPDNVIKCPSSDVASAIAEIVIRQRPEVEEDMALLSQEEWDDKTLSSLTDKEWVEVLTYALCPLSRQYMKNPVVWNDNKRAYEKDVVSAYMKEHGKDPITKERFASAPPTLKPNLNIAQVCRDYESYFNALPEARRLALIDQALPKSVTKKERFTAARSTLFATEGESTPKLPESKMKQMYDKMMERLVCSITGEVMHHPYMIKETGQIYDKAAILEWLEKNDTCPKTGTVLTDKSEKAFQTVYDMKAQCEEYYQNLEGTTTLDEGPSMTMS